MRAFFTFLVMSALALAQGAPGRTPDVPYVPTANNVVEAMLKLAGVKNTDVVYDLGCGDGRIVIAAARAYGASRKLARMRRRRAWPIGSDSSKATSSSPTSRTPRW